MVVLYLSLKQHCHYGLPVYIKDQLVRNYKQQTVFDPCPYKSKVDGLKIDWQSFNIVNPPFLSTVVCAFVQKAVVEQAKGNTSVVLFPVTKMGQSFYHDIVLPHAVVTTMNGCVKFIDLTNRKRKLGLYPYANLFFWFESFI